MLKALEVSLLKPGLIWIKRNRKSLFLPGLRNGIFRRKNFAPVWLSLFIAGMQPVIAGADSLEEYTVKTALVFNLAVFTEWPERAFEDSLHTLTLCIIGDNVVQQAFLALSGKSVGLRSLNIVNIQRSRKIEGCQIVFIGGQDRAVLAQIHAAAAERPILTVDELNDYNTFRGIVNLQKVDGRMRLNINLELARSAGLKISSRLLKLATIVSSAQ